MRDIATAQPASIILDSAPGEKRPATVLGVIPARLASTRLARKVLRTIAGRPMLAWVFEAATACPQLDQRHHRHRLRRSRRTLPPEQLARPAHLRRPAQRHRPRPRRSPADSGRHLRQHPGRRTSPQTRTPHRPPPPLRPAASRSLHPQSPLHRRKHRQPKRRKSSHRRRRPRPLLLPRHHPLQPRPRA